MSHSFNKTWIHSVWSTKERIPIIKTDFENMIFPFVSNQLKEMNSQPTIVSTLSSNSC
ncbi:MAG: hypothetical protein RBS13_06200 [Bacteroidales bacterium]|nr:hypothetical protein [Bacteroidales bacterium]